MAGVVDQFAEILDESDGVHRRIGSSVKHSASALALGLALFAASCSSSSDVVEGAPVSTISPTSVTTALAATAPTTTTTIVTTTTTAAPDPVAIIVAGLTLDEKIGQLLMPVVEGTSGAEAHPGNVRLGGIETAAGLVDAFRLGGVLYLGSNIVDAGQLSTFSAELQAASSPTVGMLIAVDQEGGRVQRVVDGVTSVPPARSLAGDPEQATSLATQTAVELRAQGINVVFAPVADLVDGNAGVIGNRSYGADPEATATMVVAVIKGLQRGGVAASAKHWPGHGATTVDSHKSLPVLDISDELWRSRERVPFVAAANAGVDMIMVGHLSLPQLDPSGVPATQSRVLVEQLLREDLGYEGVIVSDALDMGALSGEGRGEIAIQSLEAGIDLLLAPPDLIAAQTALLDAVASGRLTVERLDASVSRVLTLKLRLGLIDVEAVLAGAG